MRLLVTDGYRWAWQCNNGTLGVTAGTSSTVATTTLMARLHACLAGCAVVPGTTWANNTVMHRGWAGIGAAGTTWVLTAMRASGTCTIVDGNSCLFSESGCGSSDLTSSETYRLGPELVTAFPAQALFMDGRMSRETVSNSR